MSTASKNSVGLFKRLWHTYPEIVGSSFMGLIGIGMGITAVYLYYSKDLDNRRYKLQYTVIRDDDPRVARIRKD